MSFYGVKGAPTETDRQIIHKECSEDVRGNNRWQLVNLQSEACNSQDTTSWDSFFWVEFIRECVPDSDANGSTHNPSTADQNSALPPDTTDGVQNTISVGSAHNAHPVGDTHSHAVSKANRASQTEMQRGSNSVAKPSADATARTSGAKSPPQKPQTQGKKSLKERVEITPSYIPNQAPTPRTKMLLDRSGPVGTRQGVVSPATKLAGDRPQRLSTIK